MPPKRHDFSCLFLANLLCRGEILWQGGKLMLYYYKVVNVTYYVHIYQYSINIKKSYFMSLMIHILYIEAQKSKSAYIILVKSFFQTMKNGKY